MVYTLRFFLFKMQFFYNYKVFGSCFIHILYTGVLKLKKQFRRQKVKCSLVFSEDGRNYRPKHVELIEITNKLLLLSSS